MASSVYEHSVHTRSVRGSNPCAATNKINLSDGVFIIVINQAGVYRQTANMVNGVKAYFIKTKEIRRKMNGKAKI